MVDGNVPAGHHGGTTSVTVETGEQARVPVEICHCPLTLALRARSMMQTMTRHLRARARSQDDTSSPCSVRRAPAPPGGRRPVPVAPLRSEWARRRHAAPASWAWPSRPWAPTQMLRRALRGDVLVIGKQALTRGRAGTGRERACADGLKCGHVRAGRRPSWSSGSVSAPRRNTACGSVFKPGCPIIPALAGLD